MMRIGPIDVVEERLVAGAQVVQPGLAVGRRDEAVLRALAVAGEANVALAAVAGSVSRLASPNCALLLARRRARACAPPGCCRAGSSARRSGRTNRGRRCARAPARCRTSPRRCTSTAARRPSGERRIEHLHEHLADVASDPFVEDVDQEAAPTARPSTERSVTWLPSWTYSGADRCRARPTPGSPSAASRRRARRSG